MPDAATSPRDILQPLRSVRQYRQFTGDPLTADELDAIVDVARWSGSGRNEQPWRFIVIRAPDTIRRIAEAGMPQTRSLTTATAAIAIALPDDPERMVSRAYDEGRAAERILIAASMLGLGAGIAWIRRDVLPAIRDAFDLPQAWIVRTVMSLGRPTDEARQPRKAPGEARLPRDETVHEERWRPS